MAKIFENRWAGHREPTASVSMEGDGVRSHVTPHVNILRGGAWIEGFVGHSDSRLTPTELRALADALIAAADYMENGK